MNARRTSGWLFALLLTATTAKAASMLDKIDQARAEGRLSADQAILLKVQALKGAKTLPEEYRADQAIPERCGARVGLEIVQNWDLYGSSTQKALAQAQARPVQQISYASPGGFFVFHYDTTGPHAVPLDDQDNSGVPDYIEDFAFYADSSYRMEVFQMGYLPPPSDGDGKYDIYTQEIPYYGYAQPESPGPNPWGDFTSYIVVHRSFFGFPPNNDPDGPQKGAMKVTIAHEFHHAVQFAYSANGSAHIWFMEITSTWMEDVVFDPVDDNYIYLPYFFNEPQTPLTSTSIHMYASFIWNQYLAQNFGQDIIRQVWQENISFTSVQSLARVLQGLGTNLANEFSRFALWNLYTASRDDGQHYEEGISYPEMVVHHNSGGPTISGRSSPAPALAAAYESFNLPDSTEKVRVTFTGRSTGVWNAFVALRGSFGIRSGPFALVSSRTGDSTIFVTDSVNRLTLIGAQVRLANPNIFEYFDYTYIALPAFIRGDLNEDLIVNSVDIVHLINYTFLDILPPENHPEAADLDCSGFSSPADVVLLMTRVFNSRSFPC